MLLREPKSKKGKRVLPRNLVIKECTSKEEPGRKKFKLFKIELIYKAKKLKVPPFTI